MIFRENLSIFWATCIVFSRLLTSAISLLARDDIDAVVYTPNYLLDHRRWMPCEPVSTVLCRNPIAYGGDSNDNGGEAAKVTNKIRMVGFTHRYAKHNQVTKQLLDRGAISRPS